MALEDSDVVRVLFILILLVIGCSFIEITFLHQTIQESKCSYTNITNLYPVERVENNNYFNNITENNFTQITPMRNFEFSPRKRHYCKDPIEWSRIGGQSMFPLLDTSGTILVDRVVWKDLEVGDAILFVRNNGYVFHAITYINNEFAVTAGYNNYQQDPSYVYPADVKYRYCVPRDNPDTKFNGGEQ